MHINARVVCMHILHNEHCTFILNMLPFRVSHVHWSAYVSMCMLHSSYCIILYLLYVYHLTLLSRIHWGCLYVDFVERTKALCAQIRCVDKAFVHTKTWWSTQRLRGVDSNFVHSLSAFAGPITALYRTFLGRAPRIALENLLTSEIY